MDDNGNYGDGEDGVYSNGIHAWCGAGKSYRHSSRVHVAKNSPSGLENSPFFIINIMPLAVTICSLGS